MSRYCALSRSSPSPSRIALLRYRALARLFPNPHGLADHINSPGLALSLKLGVRNEVEEDDRGPFEVTDLKEDLSFDEARLKRVIADDRHGRSPR